MAPRGRQRDRRWWWPVVAIALISLLLSPYSAQAAPEAQEEDPPPVDQIELLLPDLITLPPTDLRLVIDRERGRSFLRFSNTVANTGRGPLELKGLPATGSEDFHVTQQLFGSNGEVLAEPVLSSIIFHEEHGHWHLEDFARYELWSVGPYGDLLSLLRLSAKISYCMVDTDPLDPEADASPTYPYCGPERQGLSAGWSDEYHANLAGQWVDVSDLPPGVYALRSVADPRNDLVESDEGNNAEHIYVRLEEFSVTIIEPPAGRPQLSPADPCRDLFGHDTC